MKEHPNDYKISRLIAKKRMAVISSEEEVRLQAWLEEDERNRFLYEQIERGEKMPDREQYVKGLDVNRSWDSVKRQMTRGARKRVWAIRGMSIAASILLLLGAGLYVFMQRGHDAEIPVAVAEVTVGSSRAVLITDRGEVVELSDHSVRQIEVGDGMVATSDGEKVSYGEDVKENNGTKTLGYNTIRVPRGGEYKLLLSDNTCVYLNADSEIRFPVKFGKGQREVFLQGEAFFEVARDVTRPFVVNAGDQVRVEVLGTRFNVQAYREENNVETTLSEGSVRVYGDTHSVKLHPDQQAVYCKKNGTLITREVDADGYSAWKDGRFVLKNITLEEIMIRLGRWYNIDVFWIDTVVKEYHFSGELARYGDFEEMLRMLERATRVRFEVKDRTVFVNKE